MEKLKENIETQQPKRDETSISTAKTPLVDALRSYFTKKQDNEVREYLVASEIFGG